MQQEKPIAATRSDEIPSVLVVDDEPLVRSVLQLGLQRHGFAVVTAENGREAIELFRELREQDDGKRPQVLLDVQMPEFDGPTVLAVLQSFDPKVRAYFMTGNSAPYTTDALLSLGAHRVFAKPLNLADVAAALQQRSQADTFDERLADRLQSAAL